MNGSSCPTIFTRSSGFKIRGVCNQNHWGRSSDNSNPYAPNVYGQPDTQNSHGNPDFTTTSSETPLPSIASAITSKPIPNAGKPINSIIDRSSQSSTP